MARFPSSAAYVAASLWLGAGFASADREPMTDVEAFTALADEHGGFPHQSFRSSDIVAPVFQINSIDRDRLDDEPYLFLGSVYGHMKAGPMIVDSRDFSLVYADQKYENAYTSEVQMIDGERYLTFWEGGHTRGHANGYCLIFDEQYNLRYNVTAQGLHGALADMHEMVVTEDRTVIFSTYFNIPYNCSAVGGPEDSMLMDSGFQEVDMETNEVLFEWAASKHFSIEDTHARYGDGFGVGPNSGFDFFHINSIQKTRGGNYLVSSRHLALLTLIDGRDGHPIWILGSKLNQFRDLSDGKATSFSWQHHARYYQNESHITMFDNHGEHTGTCKEECRSRGLHLEIDEAEMTVRLVREYYHPDRVDAGAMGGFQSLPSGNVMVAWGHTPAFVEYTFDGEPVMDVQRGKIGGGTQNDMFAYRVHKSDWRGRPTWPPRLAIEAPNKDTNNAKLWVSWNGATDIAKWAVFATNDATNISAYENLIMEVDRTGFETAIELGPRDGFRYLAAAAVDANGEVLGSTVIYDMTTSKPAVLPANIVSIHGPENSPAEESEPGPETEAEQESEQESDSNVESEVHVQPSPEPESESEPEAATGGEEAEQAADETADSAEEGKGDDEEQVASTSSFGAIVGSVVVVGGIASLAVWLLRRRTRKTDVEHSQYKPVRTED